MIFINCNCSWSQGGCYVFGHLLMIENLKIFIMDETFSAFFLSFFLDLFGLSFNLIVEGDDFLNQGLSFY